MNWLKQLNDYRNKQRDSYSQMNRQRGQNAAGVNPQRSHNNGANRQHGLNAGMSQNKHINIIILGCGIEIRKQSVFSFEGQRKTAN